MSFPLSDASTSAASALESLQDLIVHNRLQARSRARADALRRPSLCRCAQRLPGSSRAGERRRSRGRRASTRRERLLPEALRRRARRARAAISSTRRAAPKPASSILSALRELGSADQYEALTRALVNDFPDSSWSEEALNNLGTYYILNNQDDLAAQAFKECFEKFPSGQHARADGVEVRLVGIQDRQLRGGRSRLRGRGRDLPAIRLPAVVSVLGGARARTAGRARHGRIADAARLHRLHELVLRAARAQTAADPARGAVAGCRRHRRAQPASTAAPPPPTSADRTAHPTPARRGPVRRCAQRAAFRAAAWGTLSGDRSDDGLGLSREGRPPPRASPSCGGPIRSTWPPAAKVCRPRSCKSSSR